MEAENPLPLPRQHFYSRLDPYMVDPARDRKVRIFVTIGKVENRGVTMTWQRLSWYCSGHNLSGWGRYCSLPLLALFCFALTSSVACGNEPVIKQALAPKVIDVKLDAHGRLRTVVVDSNGNLRANQPVAIFAGKTPVASAMTDAEGQVNLPVLKSGTYSLVAGRQISVCRVWAQTTAPPSANSQVLCVSDTEIV